VKAATLFGKPLPDGGTIGVCAPASPFENRSEILRGVEWWEQQGYRVKLADGVWDRQAYVAGDAKSRARDLVAMFADPEVDVVQCLQGGVGSAQTIPYLDFEVIAANPKALCGYSDITALHIAVRQRTGLATIQSNGLRGMGWNETPQFNKDRLLEVLRTGGVGEVPRDPDDPYVRAIRGGTATAPLVGGNLWLIAHGMGTPYEIDAEGCILFFEAVEQPPWVIDVQLTSSPTRASSPTWQAWWSGSATDATGGRNAPSGPERSPWRTCWRSTWNRWAYRCCTSCRWATASTTPPSRSE
jgi:muramoyltetrapeptide carboxypeptidase